MHEYAQNAKIIKYMQGLGKVVCCEKTQQICKKLAKNMHVYAERDMQPMI
jgi:hypothetical protein